MPELPEVETLKTQLTDLLTGLTVSNIEVLKPKCFLGDRKLLIGKKITGVRRFAKMLSIDFADISLVTHLKMTGQLIYRGERIKRKLRVVDPLLYTLPNKHTRVIISFTSGDKLYFNDLRIFGWMKIVERSNFKFQITNYKLPILENIIGKLGPDPLSELDEEKFYAILQSSKKPVKIVLMDQEKIAGVGNIYANDTLFLSKINPKKPAKSVTRKEADILFLKLLKVLNDGIKLGGASEDNFRDAYGEMGHVQDHFAVYRKKGENCPNNCGGKIVRIVVGGRGTFYCPKCQGRSAKNDQKS